MAQDLVALREAFSDQPTHQRFVIDRLAMFAATAINVIHSKELFTTLATACTPATVVVKNTSTLPSIVLTVALTLSLDVPVVVTTIRRCLVLWISVRHIVSVSVGDAGFEPATTRFQSEDSDQTELNPVVHPRPSKD